MEYDIFFAKAKEKGINKIQITERTIINSTIEIINGNLISYDNSNNIEYEIKAEYNKKSIKVNSNYLDDDTLDLIIIKSNETDTSYQDEYLVDKKLKKNTPQSININKEIIILKELDKIRKKYSKVKKLTTYFSENYTNTRIINNMNVDISTDSHLCDFIVEALVENNGEYTSFDDKILTENKNNINFEEFTTDVINKAILQSNKNQLDTKKYNIVLSSNVTSRIIQKFTNMLSATSVRNKVTCLEKYFDKKVFNDKLSIIEDPINKNYPGYRLFDDEGTTTNKKIIIDKGIIKTYLYNNKEAKIKKIPSTGNGYTTISTKNMYILPGKIDTENILKKLKDGIYITDFMGSSNTSIDTITGNISIQIFGFIIKDGKIFTGIKPAIMTTTIFELFSNIEEIGKDLKFTSVSTGAPPLLIKDISIAS